MADLEEISDADDDIYIQFLSNYRLADTCSNRIKGSGKFPKLSSWP